MFCNASTFLGRGKVPSWVIQYPRYLISIVGIDFESCLTMSREDFDKMFKMFFDC